MNTIIEKIRAKVERLKGICTAQIKANPGQTFPFIMEMTGYDKLLSILSDLEKEEKPTTAEGLEEEIDRVVEIFNQDYVEDGKGIQYGEINIFSDLRDIARHFAKWGAEHLKK